MLVRNNQTDARSSDHFFDDIEDNSTLVHTNERKPSPMCPASSPTFRHLAARWQVIALVLVAAARQISLAYKSGAHGRICKAEELEAVLYLALVRLSADIAAAAPVGSNTARSKDPDLKFLEVAHALLSVLTLLITQLKQDLAADAERLAILRGAAIIAREFGLSAQMRAPAYLDSS